MIKPTQQNCHQCPHQLIYGVACDWQPGYCAFNRLHSHHQEQGPHKHSTWASTLAEESEFDAVKGLG